MASRKSRKSANKKDSKKLKKISTRKKLTKKVSKKSKKRLVKKKAAKAPAHVTAFSPTVLREPKAPSRRAPLPLSGGFMVISIIGLVASAIYTNSGKLTATWGVTFIMFFAVVFLASVVSITPTGDDLQN